MSKSKFKRKGKSKYVQLDGYIMRSEAWASLTPNDKAAYLEYKWRYDGHNNGRIGLGCRELAEALKSSKDTALRSQESLIEKGFIVKTKASGFSVKNRTATEWRLTEYACNLTGDLATKDFTRWTATKNLQAHQKDVQAHHRDSEAQNQPQIRLHRRTTGTVTPISADPQAHQKDTYNITMGGYSNAE